jgi:hypothetical protein
MEEDRNILENGKQPQYFGKWKTTSIFWRLEDDLNFLIGKAGLASFSFPELGTAQPQLVSFFCHFI